MSGSGYAVPGALDDVHDPTANSPRTAMATRTRLHHMPSDDSDSDVEVNVGGMESAREFVPEGSGEATNLSTAANPRQAVSFNMKPLHFSSAASSFSNRGVSPILPSSSSPMTSTCSI